MNKLELKLDNWNTQPFMHKSNFGFQIKGDLEVAQKFLWWDGVGRIVSTKFVNSLGPRLQYIQTFMWLF